VRNEFLSCDEHLHAPVHQTKTILKPVRFRSPFLSLSLLTLELVCDYSKKDGNDRRQEALRDLCKLDPKVHGAKSHDQETSLAEPLQRTQGETW